VIGVLALIGGVRFVSTTVGSRFFALASVETSDFDSRVRGPGQNDITYASQLFTEGKIDESIQVLERYIRAYPQSEFIDYVHYAAGAVYLSGARRSILSLFPRYSKGQVDRGLVHLDAAIAGSSNPRIVEESLWLHAKGELMRDRPTNAAEDLGQIVKLGGPRQEDAARLLSQIQGLR
jgi:hypothetical protein